MDQATQDKLEALLTPISSEWPGGENLTYSPLFREIQEARRADDPGLSQGSWETELKVSEWGKVSMMCEKSIRERSKDLRLATWYTESLTHQEGFAGAAFGMRLLAGMLSRFWETLHPEPDGDDLEERIGKIEWLNSQLGQTLRQVPITSPQQGGYNWYHWKESRDVDNLKLRDNEGKAHAQALAEGKLAGEVFDKSVRDSGFTWFQNLISELSDAREAYNLLDQTLTDRFGTAAPGLGELRAALEECDDVVRRVSGQYSPARPSATVARAADSEAGAEAGASTGTGTSTSTSPQKAPSSAAAAPTTTYFGESGVVRDRVDAIHCLHEVARYFRTHEPHSPVAALAERAATWAEMSLDQWLQSVIKDESTLSNLRDLLNIK
jgi:type VI secretion system protein ImpA